MPLMGGNSERQKPRNSGDKLKRTLGLTGSLWLGLDGKAGAAPGCLLRVTVPAGAQARGQVPATAVSVPRPLAEIKPNLAAGRRTWGEAPPLLLCSSPASCATPQREKEDPALC